MAVAELLGKFPNEVEELPCDEFDNILFYMQYKNEQEEKAAKKAKSQSRKR